MNTSYCCPVGSSLINGSCGCDSTGAVKSYIGVPTGANLVFNPLAVSPLTRFICAPLCPSNSTTPNNDLNAKCVCNQGFTAIISSKFGFSCVCQSANAAVNGSGNCACNSTYS